MSRRYVLFAAVYGSDAQALDGLRVLCAADRAQVAGPGLLHRDPYGRTSLQKATGSTVLRAAAVGMVVGFVAGLGTVLMWATALIGAIAGALIGHRDRQTEARELGELVGVLVPAGGCAVVAVAERDLADRLTHQFDLAEATRTLPIAGRRMAELARRVASGNREVIRALDGRFEALG
ncbi:MAG: hypothetical protein MUF35_00080 [Candidatus Nanopelagicales bacterium]|jgi:hypothetical protein|nr:hypothetical protein [Candidatus Nanopelagicales bacterium]